MYNNLLEETQQVMENELPDSNISALLFLPNTYALNHCYTVCVYPAIFILVGVWLYCYKTDWIDYQIYSFIWSSKKMYVAKKFSS